MYVCTMHAVIDLGTNTFHLLIASVDAGNIVVHQKLQIPVKIGAGGIHKNMITDDAILRAMDALLLFKNTIEQYPIKNTRVYGTAAIRDAANGSAFINMVNQQTGFYIEAISGLLEAELIYKGVRAALPPIQLPYVIIDIGGGSVECMIAKGDKLVWKQSYKSGASFLIQQFDLPDPIDAYAIEQLHVFFEHTFSSFFEACSVYKPTCIVGSAGSFDSLAEVASQQLGYTLERISNNATEISMAQAADCMNLLIHSTTLERQQIKGLVSFRIEMIVVAMLLTQWMVGKIRPSKLICSAYSLKEGMLLMH
jgi:exopolyphosphatase/guanosine-5'-triphosphate,3'-diphosphate pyrophosphatase